MTLKEVKKVITRLSAKELTAFRNWFYDFDGLRDSVQEARRDIKAGRTKSLREVFGK